MIIANGTNPRSDEARNELKQRGIQIEVDFLKDFPIENAPNSLLMVIADEAGPYYANRAREELLIRDVKRQAGN